METQIKTFEDLEVWRICRSLLYELLDHLITALDEKYIEQKCFDELKGEILGVISILNGYIRYLNRAKDADKFKNV
jgi:four helix bundle protein